MEKKWIMPSYYQKFKCKMDQCRHSCCHLWKIPISRDEYFRLVSADSSVELSDRINRSLRQDGNASVDRYRFIDFDFNGDCPLMKDGLCSIHCELGKEYLPAVCDLYPRSLKMVSGYPIACCSSSCEKVVELLIESDSLDLQHVMMEGEPKLEYSVDPELKSELLHFNELLKDRLTTLEYSIREICLEINPQAFKEDYNSSIHPLTTAFSLLDRLVQQGTVLEEITEELHNRYDGNYFQFEMDREEFEKRWPKWMYWFENVLNNSLLFENFPFVDDRFDKTGAYRGLCASYGLLRLITIGHTAIHPDMDSLVDSIAALFHLIDHSSFYYNANILSAGSALLLKL